MKRLSQLVLISFFLVSASTLFAQGEMKSIQATASDDSQITVVTAETFQDFAVNNIGEKVEVKGMVVHVCKHGGKKLFIIGEDPEKRVKITASESVSVFEPELEGSIVEVTGIIQPIEEEVVPEEEKASEDAEHKNYYHVPQFAISCVTIKTVEE